MRFIRFKSILMLNVFQVLHACYSRASPSAVVENPQLVVWSESVADILDLDPKEIGRICRIVRD
ncbi:putative protein adenylyltransferase SelO [Helianthus annuus]|nr:putative protein adenylyltransferase SelO [Helianthus annuus]